MIPGLEALLPPAQVLLPLLRKLQVRTLIPLAPEEVTWENSWGNLPIFPGLLYVLREKHKRHPSQWAPSIHFWKDHDWSLGTGWGGPTLPPQSDLRPAWLEGKREFTFSILIYWYTVYWQFQLLIKYSGEEFSGLSASIEGYFWVAFSTHLKKMLSFCHLKPLWFGNFIKQFFFFANT